MDTRLSLNIAKTNYQVFLHSNIDPNYHLLIQDILIERTSNYKILEILLDEKTNRIDHINALRKILAHDVTMLHVAKFRLSWQGFIISNYAFTNHLSSVIFIIYYCSM